MAVLRLDLLREPGLHCEGRKPVPLARKDAALLAVLAIDGACSRDALAGWLWPDVSDERARGNLRQRRFRLAAEAGRDVIEPGQVLRVATSFTPRYGDPTAELESDWTALSGDLLDGMTFDDVPEFALWLDSARQRWRRVRALALESIVVRCEAAGRIDEALTFAHRLVHEERLSDHAHRLLMRLLYSRGDISASLEVYRRFTALLSSELGESPDDATTELAVAMRRGTAGRAAGACQTQQ
jgi:DNA-binding SARP family transcriptional activator